MNDRTRTAVAVGRVIADARKNRGLSQEQLAQKSDLHRTYISLLERGIKSPSVHSLILIAEALGVRAARLLESVESERSTSITVDDAT